MSSSITLSIGVVVARERIDNPWQDCVWRAVGVFLNAPEIAGWRELRRDEGCVHYHAATLPLALHRKDAASYLANLASGEPAVYVVLRHDPGSTSDRPVGVHLATVSPYDAQAYGESGLETVTQVVMPADLVELLREFVAVHHVDEPFVKRQRQRYHVEDDHKFGQEPIVELRRRMAARRQEDGADG